MYVSQKLYMSRQRTSQHVFVVHCHQVNILSIIFCLCVTILDLLKRVVKNLERFKVLKTEYLRGKNSQVFYRHCMTLAGLLHTKKRQGEMKV